MSVSVSGLRRYELLIFDWDGTVADSTGQIVSGMQQAIATLRWPERDDEAIRSLIGLDFREGLGHLYPDADVDALMQELMRYRVGQDHARRIVEAPLYQGAHDVLQLLRGGGHQLAVATGKPRPSLDRALLHHGLHDGIFVATRTADETAPKPDPHMVKELLKVLRVPAERALVIGDTDFDLHMAAAAGVDALAVTGGAHAEDRLRAARPVAILDGVHRLPQWLERR